MTNEGEPTGNRPTREAALVAYVRELEGRLDPKGANGGGNG